MTRQLLTVGAAESEALSAIHTSSIDRPWTTLEFASLLDQPFSFALLLRESSAAAGFILCRAVQEEAELLTLAVRPEYRRRGIAESLLEKALEECALRGARHMFLEVAVDNDPAIRLYEKLKFQKTGRRKDYYGRGAETKDALVMRRELA